MPQTGSTWMAAHAMRDDNQHITQYLSLCQATDESPALADFALFDSIELNKIIFDPEFFSENFKITS